MIYRYITHLVLQIIFISYVVPQIHILILRHVLMSLIFIAYWILMDRFQNSLDCCVLIQNLILEKHILLLISQIRKLVFFNLAWLPGNYRLGKLMLRFAWYIIRLFRIFLRKVLSIDSQYIVTVEYCILVVLKNVLIL